MISLICLVPGRFLRYRTGASRRYTPRSAPMSGTGHSWLSVGSRGRGDGEISRTGFRSADSWCGPGRPTLGAFWLQADASHERRALIWDHLDNLDADPPVIMVWRSVRRGGETKTPRSRRTLELPDRCVAAPRAHAARGATAETWEATSMSMPGLRTGTATDLRWRHDCVPRLRGGKSIAGPVLPRVRCAIGSTSARGPKDSDRPVHRHRRIDTSR